MSLVAELRRLYQENEDWRPFFEMLATYTNRMSNLKIENAIAYSRLSRESVVACMRELDRLQLGTFKLGRRNSPTRLIWDYSPRSVGEAALGTSHELDAYDDGQSTTEVDDLEEATKRFRPVPGGVKPLPRGQTSLSYGDTMAEAKRFIAEQLGVDPERIEISVKH